MLSFLTIIVKSLRISKKNETLLACQVRECAKLANEAVAAGMCCVIGLQSTGEANTNQTRDEEGDCLDDFVSAPKKILQMFLTKHFPTDDCGLLPHELDLLQHQVSSYQHSAIYTPRE